MISCFKNLNKTNKFRIFGLFVGTSFNYKNFFFKLQIFFNHKITNMLHNVCIFGESKWGPPLFQRR